MQAAKTQEKLYAVGIAILKHRPLLIPSDHRLKASIWTRSQVDVTQRATSQGIERISNLQCLAIEEETVSMYVHGLVYVNRDKVIETSLRCSGP